MKAQRLTRRWLHFPVSQRHVTRMVNSVDLLDHQHTASVVLEVDLSHCNRISQSSFLYTPTDHTNHSKKSLGNTAQIEGKQFPNSDR